MKSNLIKPPQEVYIEILKFHQKPTSLENQPIIDNLDQKNIEINFIYPIYYLDSTIFPLKIDSSQFSWLVYDSDKKLMSEFSPSGEVQIFYKEDNLSKELIEFIAKKTTNTYKLALLRSNTLKLDFLWEGKKIPQIELDDKIFVCNDNDFEFEKSYPYGWQELSEKLETEIKNFQTRWKMGFPDKN